MTSTLDYSPIIPIKKQPASPIDQMQCILAAVKYYIIGYFFQFLSKNAFQIELKIQD